MIIIGVSANTPDKLRVRFIPCCRACGVPLASEEDRRKLGNASMIGANAQHKNKGIAHKEHHLAIRTSRALKALLAACELATVGMGGGEG